MLCCVSLHIHLDWTNEYEYSFGLKKNIPGIIYCGSNNPLKNDIFRYVEVIQLITINCDKLFWFSRVTFELFDVLGKNSTNPTISHLRFDFKMWLMQYIANPWATMQASLITLHTKVVYNCRTHSVLSILDIHIFFAFLTEHVGVLLEIRKNRWGSGRGGNRQLCRSQADTLHSISMLDSSVRRQLESFYTCMCCVCPEKAYD